MKFNKYIFLIIIQILSTSLIIDARYQSVPLPSVPLKNNHSEKTPISFEYKSFTKKDCKKYLNSKRIINKGYQPIQITITNNSDNDIVISPENFSKSSVNALEVSEMLHRNNVARGLGLATPGIIVGVPVTAISVMTGAMAAAMSSNIDATLCALLIPGILIMSPFIIAGMVQGFGAEEFNNNMDHDFKKKELQEQIVFSGSTITGLLFIPCKTLTKKQKMTIKTIEIHGHCETIIEMYNLLANLELITFSNEKLHTQFQSNS